MIDGRNFVDREAVKAAGFVYEGIGRMSPPAATPHAGADPGGRQGTRLRPLTSTIPKPVVPLVGRPFISYMLEWLRGHGVDDVILSCGFMADGVRDVLGDGVVAGDPAALRGGAASRWAPAAR